ncbi:MAG: beta-lactamase family protein [Phenylobacterium sp.]|uniref:serine hydrolase domain-containing protein n=1 Tax=Phenylobacterium sp. TaxID=1871053 RepID=UPI001A1E3F1F|nr:serine hydrolase domain-containing protein [Phenylobacterium sp.]MBJ7413777.1 beta-lactamase family protein [Phenylobacterium sp.]
MAKVRAWNAAGLIGLATLFFGAPAGAGQAPAGGDPVVGSHMRAYVAAVNDGAAASEAFRTQHVLQSHADQVPAPVFAEYFAQQHRIHGRLQLVETRTSGPGAAVGLVRDTTYGALHGVTLSLDPQTWRVLEFDPRPAPDWASARPKATLDAETLGRRASELAQHGCDKGAFSGAVLVAKGATILAETACGPANRRYGAALTPESKINLGSMDKMFTAVAVMQLVEAGKVVLDAPISTYLDDTWLPAPFAQRITVRHLLTHTSGLGSFLGPAYRKGPANAFKDLADYKRLVRDDTPAFEPGTRYQYSNTGMLLAGAIVEAASGESYFDYVRRHVFGPAGMTNTGAFPLDAPVANLAVGYGWAPETPWGWTENTLGYIYRGSPAGGGFSTVGDMHRFAMALEAGKLVSPAAMQVLTPLQAPNEYGAGFMISPETHAGPIVGHEGFYRGVSSQLEIYRRNGFVVVILANQDWSAPPLGDAIRGLIAAAK